MKKNRIFAFLTAAAAVCSMCSAMPVSANETMHLMGDMDGDYKITANDAQTTLDIYVESIVGNEDNAANAENGNGDIDMNGVIDVTDAQSILNYFCQTLVGGQPLWADLREVSYHDGTEYEYRQALDEGTVKNDVPFRMTGLYLEIGCAQGAPGETVTVPVYIAGIEDLIGMVMFITPPEGLTPGEITSTIADDFESPSPMISIEPAFNPEKGAMVWASAENIQIRDGYVLANYTYTIPEDAESGTVYPICFDPAKCEFIAYEKNPDYQPIDYDAIDEDNPEENELYMDTLLGNNTEYTLDSYQYTTLNGVVIVE